MRANAAHAPRRAASRPIPTAETVCIPVSGPFARVGAAIYLSILAYPRIEERQRREKFVRGVAIWYRGHRGQQVNEKELNAAGGTMRRCFDRIARRRHVAAMHARKINTAATWRDIAESIPALWKGPIPRVPTVGDLPRMLSEKRKRNQSFKDWMSKESWGNKMHRVWAESLPVLHLLIAMEISVISDRRLAFGVPIPFQSLISAPGWLPFAVDGAEQWRARLSDAVPTFPAAVAVRVVAAEPVSVASTVHYSD